ncbi:uncharacterized protein LOC133335341 [Musca vetustissima]|uniref:uncharacterized protein LOC133335341 n=1 Tax=Musca vetustissima TaxID=27455 RepID=UPI002AB68A47|nr:uncharacterized protein LOC133335341 [Musca vetustissima]
MFNQHNYLLIIIPFVLFTSANGARYEFVADNDQVYEECRDMPGTMGVHGAFDFTDLHMEYRDGSIHVYGNSTNIYKGTQPTDIVQLLGELYKFQQGDWQPTPFTIWVKDFCAVQFNPTTPWYQFWGRHVHKADRKCVNVYGQTYHHDEFTVDIGFDFPINMEGRSKLKVRAWAVDPKTMQRRPNEICFQIVGSFYKVK